MVLAHGDAIVLPGVDRLDKVLTTSLRATGGELLAHPAVANAGTSPKAMSQRGGYTSVDLPRDLAGMEELGRLDALKMHCPSGRVGSNPTPGTSRGLNRVVPSPS